MSAVRRLILLAGLALPGGTAALATPYYNLGAAVRAPGATVPVPVIATGGDTTATVTWRPVSGASSYNVYYDTSSNVTQGSPAVKNATSPYTITGLTDGVNYYVSVAAVLNGVETFLSLSDRATPQGAPIVLGQPNVTTNQNVEYGVANPLDVWWDGTHLILVDANQSRLVIWNSFPATAQQTPDVVIGQPTLSGNAGNQDGIGAMTVSLPSAVCSDGTHLFVADSSNHRVLGWNTFPTTTGKSADFVLGQPDMVSSTPNNGGISATSLKNPSGIYCDSSQLIVSDTGNNRVLIWTSLPSTTNAAANLVLGQSGFTTGTTNNGGLSASSLYFPYGVRVAGGELFVADMNNSRVLIWTSVPTANNQAASYVLGQATFTTGTSNSGGLGASSLSYPSSMQVIGAKLFVADEANNRVLIWNSVPASNAKPADLVLGQPNMTTTTSSPVNAASMNMPYAVASNGTALAVVDPGNARVLFWSAIPAVNQSPAGYQFGQPNMTMTFNAGNGVAEAATSFNRTSGVLITGTKMFVSDVFNSRVLAWNTVPTASQQAADFVLGSSNFTSTPVTCTSQTMSRPEQIAVTGTKLFVADSYHSRILIYNTIPTATNQAADVVLGQPNFTTCSQWSGGSVTSADFDVPTGVASDGTNLFVADQIDNRVLIYNAIPAANGATAQVVLGQASMTTMNFNNGGLSASSLAYPYSVATYGGKLLVSDSQNNRVLIWNTIPAANNTAANVVIGQPNLTSGTANNGGLSLSTLSNPGHLYIDGSGHLFLADGGNNRVLRFNSIPTTNGAAADAFWGQGRAAGGAANVGGVNQEALSYPVSVYYDGTYHWISDQGNDRVIRIVNP